MNDDRNINEKTEETGAIVGPFNLVKADDARPETTGSGKKIISNAANKVATAVAQTKVAAKEAAKHRVEQIVSPFRTIKTAFKAATLGILIAIPTHDIWKGEGLIGKAYNTAVAIMQHTGTCDTGEFPFRKLVCEKSGEGKGLGSLLPDSLKH